MSVVAAVLVGWAVLLWRPLPPVSRLRALMGRTSSLRSDGTSSARREHRREAHADAGAAGTPALPFVALLPGRRAKPAQVAASVVEVASAFADELRAGRLPREAWSRASQLAPAVSAHSSLAAAHGADVAAALVRDAQRPGAQGLARIAACWTVGEQRGAGLASAVARVVSGLRDEATHRREVASAMAGPRATVLVLAGLPLMGLAMGSAVGVHPLDFLLHTPIGWGCLVVGCALESFGIVWVQRMVAKAERDA